MVENEIVTFLQSVKDSGMYAIIHFMGFDVFREPLPSLKLQGNAQKIIKMKIVFNQRMIKVYSGY